jgi:hypothetical protein
MSFPTNRGWSEPASILSSGIAGNRTRLNGAMQCNLVWRRLCSSHPRCRAWKAEKAPKRMASAGVRGCGGALHQKATSGETPPQGRRAKCRRDAFMQRLATSPGNQAESCTNSRRRLPSGVLRLGGAIPPTLYLNKRRNRGRTGAPWAGRTSRRSQYEESPLQGRSMQQLSISLSARLLLHVIC